MKNLLNSNEKMKKKADYLVLYVLFVEDEKPSKPS